MSQLSQRPGLSSTVLLVFLNFWTILYPVHADRSSFGWSCIHLDNRLHDSSGFQDDRWSHRQDVLRLSARCFIFFYNGNTDGAELRDVVIEDR
jgi:hypothetical protein